MADYISREAALKAAEHAYGEWNLAMAAADGARQINLVYKRQELLKAVASVFDIVPAADVEPVQRWILCKDRPPKECGRYQAVVESEAFPGSSYIDTLSYDKFGWRDGCCYVNGVSHWMPLPEPPEEGGAGE